MDKEMGDKSVNLKNWPTLLIKPMYMDEYKSV